MIARMPYKSLNHALRLFKGQVIEGIPYADKNIPKFSNPSDLFNWLKLRTTYKKDPKNRELFQTLPTLMENNWHGVSGAGDCDCFTIASLTACLANGFDKIGIVLVGRNPITPVHIYQYIDTDEGRKYLDLTNKYFDFERRYPYRQEIPLVLNNADKKKLTWN
jgi:hypothetical protein